jgi:hydrogenase maturation protease
MSGVRILGIGSPSGDDQAGWLVVDALLASGMCAAGEGILIQKLDRPGAGLIPLMDGASRVILIDAMQSNDPIGRIQRFDADDWPAYSKGLSSHGFGVLDAVALAQALGKLPPRMDLYGIGIGEAIPCDTPCIEVQAAAQQLAVIIATELAGILPT